MLHAIVLLAKPPEPVLGKNIPVLTHPVRVRLLVGQPAPLAPAALAAGANGMAPPAQTLPAAAPEGSIEAEPTNFAESSERYFTRDELDGRPAVIDPPDLGAEGLSPLLEGSAVLLFYLDEHGGVDRIELEQSTLPASMLAQLELQREHIKFKPGRINGIAVKSVVRFEIALGKAAAVNQLAAPAAP